MLNTTIPADLTANFWRIILIFTKTSRVALGCCAIFPYFKSYTHITLESDSKQNDLVMVGVQPKDQQFKKGVSKADVHALEMRFSH